MPLTKTFHGFIENSTDTLLIIEACRTGILPTVNRRLIERERSSIISGTIIVFDENESGIKRWTDGFLWSPSRILGDFLVYRELENKDSRRPELITSYAEEENLELQRERALVGSLTTSNTSYNFKKDGLIKKTIRVLVNGNYLHIINYYNKNDVLRHLLPTPSKSQQLSCLSISSDLIPHLNGCNTNNYGHSTRQKNRGGGRVAGNVKSEYRPYPSRNDMMRGRLPYPSLSVEEPSYMVYNQKSFHSSAPPTSTPPNESFYPPSRMTSLPHPSNQEKPHGLYPKKIIHRNGSYTEDPISPSPTPSPPITMGVDPYYRNDSNHHSYYQRKTSPIGYYY